MNPELTPESYIEQMEKLLERLHQEIDQRLNFLPAPLELKQFDDYIYQLNSFYYGSFHKELFPLYRQLIQEDIQSRLNLTLQENTLRQGILGNIKRYAQLYNQVKKLTASLSQGKTKTYQLILANERYADRSSIELYTSLKLWREHLQATEIQFKHLALILNDREFDQVLSKTPRNWPALHFLEGVDLGQPLHEAAYTALISYLSYCSSLLRQMQKEERPFSGSFSLIKEMEVRTAELGRSSIPPSFHDYRSYLSGQMGSFLQILPRYLKLNELEPYKQAVRKLLQLIDDNIILLDKSQRFLISGCREALLQVWAGPDRQPEDIDGMQKNLNRIIDSLNELESEFSRPGESDFQNFSQHTKILLEEAGTWLSKFTPDYPNIQILTCFAGLYHLDLERQYMLRNIELTHEANQRRRELQEALLQVINDLDSFINLLGNIRADLERLLAPRNLSRIWKDLDVRVERIPLEKGKPFPPRFLSLLDKYEVNRQPLDTEEVIVLHEEGDLFIIRVGDEQDEELPSLVVSRRE